MARVKPATQDAIVLRSLTDVDNALRIIAGRKRELAVIAAAMNESIEAARAAAMEAGSEHWAEIIAQERALLKYAEYHKPELFAQKKSLALTHGEIGYRLSSKLKLAAKQTWERVLGKLREADMRGYIRVKEEVDKEALRELSAERLALLGCKLCQEDVFYYEVPDEEIAATGE